MTRLGNTHTKKTVVLSRCRLLANMTNGKKMLYLLREYKIISDMSLEIYI